MKDEEKDVGWWGRDIHVHVKYVVYTNVSTTQGMQGSCNTQSWLLVIKNLMLLSSVLLHLYLCYMYIQARTRVSTGVNPGAWLAACWRGSPTRDGRVDHRRPTVTLQLSVA